MSDENKPKDRNEAVRSQLLKKRTDEAKKKVPLAAGELVDDALARATHGSVAWLKSNAAKLAGAGIVAILVGAGYLVYEWRASSDAQAASVELGRAVLNQRGYISETPRTDEENLDPTPTFKTRDERAEAALSAYRGVWNEHKKTGAGMLARLGEAGVLLDKQDWDAALAAYRDVKDSPLGKADDDVRARALEGIGFALEGKKDVDNAIKTFRELENTDLRGFKELGMYHQARLHLGKGETDKAKELLAGARERLQRPSDTRPFTYLEVAVDDLLRQIDPSAVPQPAGVGGRPLSAEDIRRLQEEFQRRVKEAQEKAQGEHGDEDHEPAPVPVETP